MCSRDMQKKLFSLRPRSRIKPAARKYSTFESNEVGFHMKNSFAHCFSEFSWALSTAVVSNNASSRRQ